MSVLSLCDPTTIELKNVDVIWKHLQLQIVHRSSKYVLFSTDGIFLQATTSHAEFEESRGFFRIAEDNKDYSKEQRIKKIIEFFDDTSEKKIRIKGDFGEHTDEWTLDIWEDVETFLRMHIESPSHNRLKIIFTSKERECLYGFGEQLTHCNLKGHQVSILSQEPGIGRGIQPLTWFMNRSFGAGGTATQSSSPAPLFISSEGRGFLCENYEYSIFDLTHKKQITYEIYASQMGLRLWHSQKPLELIEQLTRYTGRMPVLPKWIDNGAIIGLQGGTERVRSFWKKLQKHAIPIAAFWLQDWIGQRRTSVGKQLWWNWELDEEHYPHWSDLHNDFEKNHIAILGYINPFIVNPKEKGSFKRNLYEEAQSKGYLIQHPKGGTYLIKNTSFSAALVDLSNPEAYTWLKEVIKKEMLAIGIKGWMADFAEALPFDAVLFEGYPKQWHNKYTEVWSKLNREVIEEVQGKGELLFFNRAGFTKSPSYSTLYWMGDQLASWRREDGIKSAVVGLLSSGFSGISMTHGDIGGYIATTLPNLPFRIPGLSFARGKELLMRWIEFSAFTTIFRTHEGNQPDNHIQIDEDDELLSHFAKYAKIYVALSRYRRLLLQDAQNLGHPVTRHLWLHYPDDENVINMDLQFLLGKEIIVAPVLEPNISEHMVYLPRGSWTHLWSRKEFHSSGETVEVSAPVGQIPVFIHSETLVLQELQQEVQI